MELERIEKREIPSIYEQMRQNFVIEELRDYEDALLVCDNPKYCIYNIIRTILILEELYHRKMCKF